MSLAAALAEFSRAGQAVSEDAAPGSAVLAGLGTFACSATVGRLEPVELQDGGTVIVQPLYLTIRKTLLATAPVRGLKVTCKNRPWKLNALGGDNDADAAWHLICIPMPGTN